MCNSQVPRDLVSDPWPNKVMADCIQITKNVTNFFNFTKLKVKYIKKILVHNKTVEVL